ncbi:MULTISPECIES: fasciclin domain-containing protein [Cyanophyceae]|uniref:fasciclin domain-containing protein n=1 Tax=Cyanophyceae TaxID=3028117 RepID=UPI001686CE86|nr:MULTISPECIES: fasciclin domain-containing protein [Cyanophyceae]MBD1917726.1 fasciclin domain-containing protein [Phormidium sp. FACHB-77]MBD2032845.1 fasciclin domain-containing protein [Phormidium sp. FACHB-322]MBD2051592.1 fasciclin domain-containing protein [Leptolyngbya sp. FACHB-60]
MTPNTLRIALGLILFGAAPAAIAAFPQQAISDTYKPQAEQPAAMEMEEPTDAEQPGAMEEATDAEQSGAMEGTTDAEQSGTMEEPTDAEQPTASTEQSIAEIAAGSEDFEILTAAIEAAGLTEALNNSELSITVFAPTDEAFEALPEGTLEELLLPENRDQLAELLTYHVVDGEVRSTDLTSGEVDTLTGAPVTVTVGEESVTINEANVVTADIKASNGIIHVIDTVLLPM